MMLLRLLTLCGILFVTIECVPVVEKKKQVISSLPGFIPVYIRPGNTPLEDINPDLAEAFKSYAEKHVLIDFDDLKRKPDIVPMKIAEKKKGISFLIIDNVRVDNLKERAENEIGSIHIQKIPKV